MGPPHPQKTVEWAIMDAIDQPIAEPIKKPNLPDIAALSADLDRKWQVYQAFKAAGEKPSAEAALTEWRKANTALARAKKLVQGPVEPVSAEELVRLSGYRETVSWVMENMYADACPAGASKLAKSLWKVAQEDQTGFLKTYMPLLLRGEKSDEVAQDEGGEVNLQLLRDMIEEFQGRCPHCGRGGAQDGPTVTDEQA